MAASWQLIFFVICGMEAEAGIILSDMGVEGVRFPAAMD